MNSAENYLIFIHEFIHKFDGISINGDKLPNPSRFFYKSLADADDAALVHLNYVNTVEIITSRTPSDQLE